MAKRKARRTTNTKAKKKSRILRKAQSRSSARRPVRKASRSRRIAKLARAKGRPERRLARKTAAKPAARKRVTAKSTRPKPPALQRERRRLGEEPVTASVPSSLNFDRAASSAKSGRNAMLHHRREHTETGPAMTGGDMDADWEEGYAEGDEAPGGDNPTPDQDVVEEIGRASAWNTTTRKS